MSNQPGTPDSDAIRRRSMPIKLPSGQTIRLRLPRAQEMLRAVAEALSRLIEPFQIRPHDHQGVVNTIRPGPTTRNYPAPPPQIDLLGGADIDASLGEKADAIFDGPNSDPGPGMRTHVVEEGPGGSGHHHPTPRQVPQKTAYAEAYFVKLASQNVWKHAANNHDREVGGVLVGHKVNRETPKRCVVKVVDAIPGPAGLENRTSFQFKADTWKAVNRIMDEKYGDPERKIYKLVGWFHSHPGFGIFLSDRDLFLHKNFFREPWHLAYVVDPLAHSVGLFGYTRDGKDIIQLPDPGPIPDSWRKQYERLLKQAMEDAGLGESPAPGEASSLPTARDHSESQVGNADNEHFSEH